MASSNSKGKVASKRPEMTQVTTKRLSDGTLVRVYTFNSSPPKGQKKGTTRGKAKR